jgi:hypothetical protein
LDKSLKSCPPCYSQSPLLTYISPSPLPRSKSCLELIRNVNIVQYTKSSSLRTFKIIPQKPPRNSTFTNAASGGELGCSEQKMSKARAPARLGIFSSLPGGEGGEYHIIVLYSDGTIKVVYNRVQRI